ncbi:MYG1 protein-like isoform X2 [Salvia hispanica]|uniref:MYG1 protein-like isoform X2 n=1 Tax=Salvia hispanica TaxID=49212 RepID=UPI002009C599|nr:MYG1 protein-like isoform X2 [Salvia hispanica]
MNMINIFSSSFAGAIQRRAFAVLSNRILSCGWRSLSSSAAPKRVGTHDGKFHCDEALGCFIIRRTAKFYDADIVRSRDPLVLEKLDAVLDVGGVYDPSRDRYDHHQKGFEEVFGCGYVTKLSSAGLVYKHYGKEIIAKEVQLDTDHPDVHRLFLTVYKNFIEAVDAIDNGISQYNTTQLPRFVNNTSLSSRVERLNPDWICPNQSLAEEDESFQQAMKVAGNEFLECINFHAKSWLPARSVVMNSLLARKSIDSSGEIIMLTNSVPWKLHIFELEKELKITPSIKYVVYADDRSEKWRLQAVAVGPDKFDSRKPLPPSWRGLNDDELSQVSGISGCTFVHISGFIGGNRTYDGALAMARTSLMLA